MASHSILALQKHLPANFGRPRRGGFYGKPYSKHRKGEKVRRLGINREYLTKINRQKSEVIFRRQARHGA